MSGDGVSMPTVLSQLANVAKAQARSQQAGATGAGPLTPVDKEQLQPLRKVPEAEKTEKQTIDPRRDGGRRDRPGQEEPEEPAEGDEEQLERQIEARTDPSLGMLIDRKA